MGAKSGHVVFADTTPAKCTFEDIEADDLLDAVCTLKPRPADNRLLALPGLGMQAIDWAVADPRIGGAKLTPACG